MIWQKAAAVTRARVPRVSMPISSGVLDRHRTDAHAGRRSGSHVRHQERVHVCKRTLAVDPLSGLNSPDGAAGDAKVSF
jgi:hypothetical protein